MRCPQCNGSRSRVLNTRPRRLDTITYRSRQCLDCGTQWPTYEISMQPEILRRRAVVHCVVFSPSQPASPGTKA